MGAAVVMGARRRCVRREVFAVYDAEYRRGPAMSQGLRGHTEARLYPQEPAHFRNVVWLEITQGGRRW